MTSEEAITTLELAISEVEWNYPLDISIALETAIEALKKQIPRNHFQNECECIVDYDILYKSIDNKCKSENCYLHNEYSIILRNGYPTVCINRQRYYVHVLIGEFIYGKIRKGYVIHHKDKNKLNAMPDNLELMTNLRHSKIHGEDRKGIDLRSEEGKENSINAAKEARRRKDVTKENVLELRNKGLTISEIAAKLNSLGISQFSDRINSISQADLIKVLSENPNLLKNLLK